MEPVNVNQSFTQLVNARTQQKAREDLRLDLIGENGIDIVNNPCETPYRSVISAAGIVSTAPTGIIEGLTLSANSEYCFNGIGIPLTIKPYDGINPTK